jgi:hypothetical protein
MKVLVQRGAKNRREGPGLEACARRPVVEVNVGLNMKSHLPVCSAMDGSDMHFCC